MYPRLPSRRDLSIAAAVAAAVLVATWWWVLAAGVGGWERSTVDALVSLPDALWWPLWLVMQLGTLVGAVLVGGALAVRHDRVAPLAALVAAGLIARTAAALAKDVVERGRPPAVMPLLDPRHSVDGFGYPSGHTAMSAAIAAAAWPWLGDRLRAVAVAAVAAVGLARMVAGVHFPLDVVGGAALGVLAGVAVTAVAARPSVAET